MKKNYIITAHKNPQQLARLVHSLNDHNAAFYIHINADVDIAPFEAVLSFPYVFFIQDRVKCIWGNFGLVQATINVMTFIAETNTEGWCIWLSGQDYPVKNAEQREAVLAQNEGFNFIDLNPVEYVLPTQWKKRLLYYRFTPSQKQYDYFLLPGIFTIHFLKHFPQNLAKIFLLLSKGITLNTIFSKIKHKRTHPVNIAPYGGSTWWALNFATLKKVVSFIRANTAFVQYHQDTSIPDELFFQTIINHLCQTDPSIKIKPSLTFVNWNLTNAGSSPAVFTAENYSEIMQLPETKIFARKFDAEVDSAILDLIDRSV
ncbi:MAG: beta-1,6-N-acetylglucosaminyltransferase [Chitinophagaceae bacterium]